MIPTSAGLLLYRITGNALEVFLVHPGGPFFKNKDLGVWSVPKGEYAEDEDPLAAAKREFFEETGFAPQGVCIPLQPVRQKSGKRVHAWAVEGSMDADKIVSNTFNMEWPPRSGKFCQFPEVDKGAWFTAAVAKEKINAAQAAFIEQLAQQLNL